MNFPGEVIDHTEALIERARKNIATHGHAWFTVEKNESLAKAHIFGDIGHFSPKGAGFEEFCAAIGDSKIVILLLDSFGGRLAEAFKIHELLSQRITGAIINGRCYSSALLIAMAARHIAITPGSQLLLHATKRTVFGTAPEMLQAASQLMDCDQRAFRILLDRTQPRSKVPNHEAVLAKCCASAKPIVINGPDTIKTGFADEMIESADEGIKPMFERLQRIANGQ